MTSFLSFSVHFCPFTPASYPHFVRCLKPNDHKLALSFNKDKILEQLQYTGIMETIKIRQQGFSHRIPFADFLRRYSFLVFSFDERIVANRDTCKLLLLRLNMDGFAIGKTKVFLKYYHVEYLSRLYEEQIRKIIRVQACVRRWLARRRAEKERWSMARSVVIVQKYARGWLARKRYSDAKANTMVRNRQGASSTSPDLTPKRRVLEGGHHAHQPQPRPHGPGDAAVLIQKHVRGYLTRKRIKAANEIARHQQHQPQQHHQQHHQQPRSASQANQATRGSAGVGPKFVSERMQLYQNDNSLDPYNQHGNGYGHHNHNQNHNHNHHNGNSNKHANHNQRNDNHNNRPKLSQPKAQLGNNKNDARLSGTHFRKQSDSKNGHNGHNGHNAHNNVYPHHFQKLEIPLNLK